ncbi:hypothetical protein A3781_08155 [Bacillus badius]|nr:hypothetical protein A3781_08155 [Bacillus badius]
MKFVRSFFIFLVDEAASISAGVFAPSIPINWGHKKRAAIDFFDDKAPLFSLLKGVTIRLFRLPFADKLKGPLTGPFRDSSSFYLPAVKQAEA